MLVFFPILAQNPAGSILPQLMMMGAIFLVFYFFMIRPQMNRAKEQQAFIAGLQKGDWVVMSGGIHGKIARINSDSTMMIEADKTTTLKVERAMVSVEYTKSLQQSLKAAALPPAE